MIPFNNLQPLSEKLVVEIEEAVARVLASGWYILGPEVEQFEQAFAKYCGAGYCVSVANGTDAIELALRVADIGHGDEVITVAHTAVATVSAIERAGATPVLVDINETSYTMDPEACAAAITPRTKAIVPVHLYGQAAELSPLLALAAKHQLLLIEDCAQAHGARYRGARVGTLGTLGTFSFYPTKNLGAYGDGGAIVTNDAGLAARLKRLRFYGQAKRYESLEQGINSRLDEMQAAILGVKLRYLDEHNDLRRTLAGLYNLNLSGVANPSVLSEREHVYHLYVARHPARDWLREQLHKYGVETQIHYPIPVHLQQGYRHLGYSAGSLPITERIASEILSLPLYPGLSRTACTQVAATIAQLTKDQVAHAA